jgi:hypothetical protein
MFSFGSGEVVVVGSQSCLLMYTERGIKKERQEIEWTMDKRNEDALAPDEVDDLEAVHLTLSSSLTAEEEEQMICLRVQHQLEGSSSLEVSAYLQKSTVYMLKERVRTALGPAARGCCLRLTGL